MSSADALVIRTGLASDVTLPIAGLGARSFAFLVDWHIRLILALAWLFGVTLAVGASGLAIEDLFVGFFRAGRLWVYLVLLPAMAIYFLYHPVLEVMMKGRTPGKRMAGVRIVNLDGQTPSAGALLLRNVFRLIDSLPAFYAVGFVFALFHPRALRIGDVAAGTLLVYESEVPKDVIKAATYFASGDAQAAARLELVDDLLARWDALERSQRTGLAARLLSALGESPNGSDDATLRARLAAWRERQSE